MHAAMAKQKNVHVLNKLNNMLLHLVYMLISRNSCGTDQLSLRVYFVSNSIINIYI